MDESVNKPPNGKPYRLTNSNVQFSIAKTPNRLSNR